MKKLIILLIFGLFTLTSVVYACNDLNQTGDIEYVTPTQNQAPEMLSFDAFNIRTL